MIPRRDTDATTEPAWRVFQQVSPVWRLVLKTVP